MITALGAIRRDAPTPFVSVPHPLRLPFLLSLLTLDLFVSGGGFARAALRFSVDAGTRAGPVALLLNDAVHGWTHPAWTELYQDLNVRYRRMDQWLNAFDVVQRRPDGGLHFDFGPLDAVLADATAGYSILPYPVLGYSPACLVTDLLETPLRLGPTQAWLLPQGTFLLLTRWVGEPPASPAGRAEETAAPRTLLEISRKGAVLWRREGVRSVVPTDSGSLLISQSPDGIVEVDPGHREVWTYPRGRALQRLTESRVLVLFPNRVSEVHEGGKEVWTYSVPARYAQQGPSGDTWVVRSTSPRIDRVDRTERLRWSVTPQDNPDLTDPLWVSEVPEDRLLVMQPDSVLLLDADKKTVWKHAGRGIRGVTPTRDGGCLVGDAGGIRALSPAGAVVWSLPIAGVNSLQAVSSPGMETVVYGTQSGACEVSRDGRLWWQYENWGDASSWTKLPPELLGWSQLTGALLTHFSRDLALRIPEWELWNAPQPFGAFWWGNAQQYFDLCVATAQTMRQVDPSLRLHVGSGGGAGGWARALLGYLGERSLEPGGLAFESHAALGPEPTGSGVGALVESLRKTLEALKQALAAAGPSPPRLVNAEWTLLPEEGGTATDSFLLARAVYETAATALMAEEGVDLSVPLAMASDSGWPVGWVLTPPGVSPVPDARTSQPAGGSDLRFTPSYHAARLWSLLGRDRLPVRREPEAAAGSPVGLLAARKASGEVTLLLWNGGGAEESVTLSVTGLALPGPEAQVRRYLIDAEHGGASAGGRRSEPEMVESRTVSTASALELPVAVPPLSVQLVVVASPKLEARAAFADSKERTLTVPVHHPIRLEAGGSLGVPAYYRWDTGQGAKPRGPGLGVPTGELLFGPAPTLARGYARPGRYTITLTVAASAEELESGGSAGASKDTLEVVVVPDHDAPPRPARPAATTGGSGNSVYLQWSLPPYRLCPDLAGFHIYRASTAAPAFVRLTDKPLLATGYVDRGIPYGAGYRYALVAVDRAGNESPRSEPAEVTPFRETTKPPPPLRLSGSESPDGDLTLEWTDASLAARARVVGYHVYRSQDSGGAFTRLTEKPTPYNRYVDPEASPRSAYRVTAVDLFGNESDPTAVLRRVSPEAAPPEEGH